MISFLLCIFLLLKNAVIFKKAYVSLCFFPFLSTHADAFLCCFWKFIICICFGVLFTTKNFCFCLLEVPHYGRKCLILSKIDVIFFFLFFSRVSCMIWFEGLFGSQMTKTTQTKCSIVWWIFDGFSRQKGFIPFLDNILPKRPLWLGRFGLFFNIIWCFTSQFAQHWIFFCLCSDGSSWETWCVQKLICGDF